jgi:hypothetical protein
MRALKITQIQKKKRSVVKSLIQYKDEEIISFSASRAYKVVVILQSYFKYASIFLHH